MPFLSCQHPRFARSLFRAGFLGILPISRRWRANALEMTVRNRGISFQIEMAGGNERAGIVERVPAFTRLFASQFKVNGARLQVFALTYNQANFLRQLVLPKPIAGWTLTTLREKLIKIGTKVVRHSKHVIFQLAEGAVPRKLFAAILTRIARLRPKCASRVRLEVFDNATQMLVPRVRGCAERAELDRTELRKCLSGWQWGSPNAVGKENT
jgi:hypothetical protein